MSCYQCGRPGHIARHCSDLPGYNEGYSNPSNDVNHDENMVYNYYSVAHINSSNNGAQRCYRCNEFGHIARDCLSVNDIRTCYNCGQIGHIRTECTMPLNATLSINNNSRNFAQCYRCGQFGHLAKHCWASLEINGVPVPGLSDGTLSDQICFICSRPGHIAISCPENNRTDIRDVICYCCGRTGHLSRDCPDSQMKCYSCGLIGHMARDCSNNCTFFSLSQQSR